MTAEALFRTHSLQLRGLDAALGPEVEPREALERLRGLLWVTDAALSHLSLDALLPELLERIRRVTRADTATVLLRTEGGSELRVRASIGLEEEVEQDVRIPIGQGLEGTVAKRRQPVIVDDVSRVQVVRPALRQLGSMMVAPLLVEGNLLGVLDVGTRQPHHFREADLQLLTVVADRVALAIDRGRLFEGAQAELRASSLLEAVIDQIPAGILIAEAVSGRVVQGNARIGEILRHPLRPTTDVEAYASWDAHHPDGRPVEPHEFPLVRALRGEQVSGEDMLYRRGDGTRGWIRASAAPVRSPTGEVVAGVVILFDVDEERRTQMAERFLADASQLLASSLDYEATLSAVAWLCTQSLADGCAIDIAAPDGTLRRLTVVSTLPGRAEQVRELESRYPTPLDAAAGNVRAFRTGEPLLFETITDEMLRAGSQDEEHYALWKSIGMYSAMCVPLIARERTLGVITLVAHDPARRFTEADLRVAVELARRAALAVDNARLYSEAEVARREAEAASRAKSEFLATMSHELRTPINAVMGYTEILELGIGGPVTETQKHYLDRIRVSNRHLLDLINEILDLAKIESGRMVVERTRNSMAEVVAEAFAELAPQAARRGIRVENHCRREGDAVYFGDPSRVRQILVNLLSNAVKFTPEGGWVRVSCGITGTPEPAAQLAGEGAWTYLRVEDNGMGIPPEKLESIFQPFVQAEGGLTRPHGGTGLGLTISRQFARLMEGDLTVRSERDRGSIFTLWLPAGSVVAEPTLPLPVPELQPAALPGLVHVATVLLGEIDAIVAATNERLRADPLVPGTAALAEPELADHQPSFLADIVQSLVLLEHGQEEPELLRDGSEIQRMIAERHGAQRARYGWNEEALRREFQLLGEEVERAVARLDLAPDDPGRERALTELVRMLQQAERVSLRGLRLARAARGLPEPGDA